MSYLSISNQYSMYSNLISQTYGMSMSSSVSDSLMNMYSYIYNSGSSSSSAVSSDTSEYLVDLKESAAEAKDKISSVKSTIKDSSKISANSDNSSAVSASYTGSEKRDDIKIDVEKLAAAQVNESDSLKSNASTLYYKNASDISITTSEGKSYSFNYSAKITETDQKALTNIAEKINKANIGVTATVENDEKTNTSKLVITGAKEGEGNDFIVSGGLAEAIGINTVKTAATDAVYSINGERKTSAENTVKVDDELTINLNQETEETATISFGESNLDKINSARELVNAFNGIANSAYSSNDSGAEKLGSRLQSIANTYSSALGRIGVTMNSKGYLEIDEDKMNTAAENGQLDKFFEANSKNGLSYGFVNKLENIASQAYDDPTKFLSSSARAEVNGSSNDSYYNTGANSYNYISAYYRYSTTALLFSAMV